MARFFVSLFSVLLFVSYCESALHRCIYPYYGGFLFDKCVEGEVAVKWRANQSLRFRLLIRKTYESNNFVLNINDFCQLWFYGRMNSYLPTAEWQFEDYSTLAVCSDPSNCDLKIDTNGTLRRLGRGAPRDPICSHMHLRNEINDEWVWTKVRLSGLPEGWLVSVDVANASLGSVTEYYDAPSCFKQLPAGNGFRLVDCSYALLSIKWKKTDVLTAVHLAPGMNMVERQFQFYINDQCSLYFTGITKKEQSYGKWQTGDAAATVLVNCSSPNTCHLIIDTDGVVRLKDSNNSRVSLCNSTTITRFPLDDEWVWATFRFIEFPQRWKAGTFVESAPRGAVVQYIPKPPRDRCIEPNQRYNGFMFENCQAGDVKIKFLKLHEVHLLPRYLYVPGLLLNLTLIVNDKCKLLFVGKTDRVPHNSWTTANGKVLFNCWNSVTCGLRIDNRGVLRRLQRDNTQKALCPRSILLRNPITDSWYWTKIRIESNSRNWKLEALVPRAIIEEGWEYTG